MQRNIVRTAEAPAAIGPYSQAVVVPVGGQRMVFCSGQIALDPATGDDGRGRRRGADAAGAREPRRGARGGGRDVRQRREDDDLLADMGDFATVNAIYGERFVARSARARDGARRRKLPRGALVEIDAIAVI